MTRVYFNSVIYLAKAYASNSAYYQIILDGQVLQVGEGSQVRMYKTIGAAKAAFIKHISILFWQGHYYSSYSDNTAKAKSLNPIELKQAWTTLIDTGIANGADYSATKELQRAETIKIMDALLIDNRLEFKLIS